MAPASFRLVIKCSTDGCPGSCRLAAVEVGARMAGWPATYRACGKPYTRFNVAAVSGPPALTLIVTHSPLLLFKAEGEDTRWHFYGEPGGDAYANWECAFASPPLIFPEPEGQPRVWSSD